MKHKLSKAFTSGEWVGQCVITGDQHCFFGEENQKATNLNASCSVYTDTSLQLGLQKAEFSGRTTEQEQGTVL